MNRKKVLKYFLSLMILCIQLPVAGQSNGLISQYMFNRLLINPGYSGNEECLSVTFLHKNQWSGVAGAPVTNIISAHTPFNNRNGLGLSVINDQSGGLSQNGLFGSYAYRIKGQDYVLSMGLQAGITFYRYQPLFVRDMDDPVFEGQETALVEPDFGTGLYYENKNMYMGISVPQLFSFGKNENISYSLQRKSYIFDAGYSFKLSDAFTVSPTTLIYLKNKHKPEINININLLFDEKIWFGVLYRNLDNLGFLCKVHVTPQIQMGYGYDITTGKLSSLSGSSHEIMLKYSFIKVEKNVVSPRFF